MTREETAKIVYVVINTYPVQYKNLDSEKLSGLIQVWQAIMEEYSYQDVEMGLYAYISADTSGFPPAPGQVIDKIKAIHPQEREIDALEAWAIVEKAVSDSAYNHRERFAELPLLCQKAVGSPDILHEWATMDIEQFQTVEQSHFIRVFDTVKKRQKEFDRLPSKARAMIETATEQMPKISEKLKEEKPRAEREYHPDIEDRIEKLKQSFEERRIVV